MSILLISHERCLDHDTGDYHPERPDRLRAALAGIDNAGFGDDVVRAVAPAATVDQIAAVHPLDMIDGIADLAAAGGGRIDADTITSAASFEAASFAAGAGLAAIESLAGGHHDAAMCVVRPPGHHATADRSMGFCLFNSVAIAATALADAGERVAIVDYDAHHGNGTEAIFYRDPRVLFVSMHQVPLYPGTGAAADRGMGEGLGYNLNVPMPAGATGDVFLRAFDELVGPQLEAFAPTWLLISAGFDGHRADPITELGLTSGDYAALTRRLLPIVDSGRRMVFLEGGYDLAALTACTAGVAAELVGASVPVEEQTSGGPGMEQLVATKALWSDDDR